MPPTSKPSESGSGSGRGPVVIDAELAARLVEVLDKLGTASTLDELNEGRALALIASLAERAGGASRAAATPDPARARAARDYDVLRGLLGRAGAPAPLRMHREKRSNTLVIDDKGPPKAVSLVVESPGDGTSGPTTEVFNIRGQTYPLIRRLVDITPAMTVARVELLDDRGELVAFGPSLPPLP